MSENGARLSRESTIRIRGTMLWFNEAKNSGAVRTEDGEEIEVLGSAFLPGETPVGRCSGRTVQFNSDGDIVSAIEFLPEADPRRARSRRRRW